MGQPEHRGRLVFLEIQDHLDLQVQETQVLPGQQVPTARLAAQEHLE